AVEDEARRRTTRAHHFEVAPAHAPRPAGPEGFHGRLLGGEADRVAREAAAAAGLAVRLLRGREDTRLEAGAGPAWARPAGAGEDRRRAPVAAREERLQVRLAWALGLGLDGGNGAERPAEVSELAPQRRDGLHRLPLKRRPRFRYEGVDRDQDAAEPRLPAAGEPRADLAGEIHDRLHVLVRLGREPDHH